VKNSFNGSCNWLKIGFSKEEKTIVEYKQTNKQTSEANKQDADLRIGMGTEDEYNNNKLTV
jgi:hypothetical protein